MYFRLGFAAGTPSSYRGPLQALPGFDQVELLLCGFTLSAESHEAPLGRAAVNVQKLGYDASTGLMEVGVTTQFATDGQGAASEVTFVVVLTDSAAARFTRISTGCGGPAECDIIRLSGSAVPAGMSYIGIATQIWDVGVRSGPPTPVNGIGGDVASLAVSPPSVWSQYIGVLRDGAWARDMFCEWQGVVIAFDPAEISPVTTSLPYQYTFLGQHQTARLVLPSQAPPPPWPAVGFLDALQGTYCFHSQSINGPESSIWMLETSATAPVMGPSSGLTTYGVFLGTRFGDTANANPDYGFQFSRAVGYLH
jgi:hypothetical protein